MTKSAAGRLPADVRLALFVYNLFFPLVLAVLLPGYLLRMFRRGNFRENFGQRFGRYSESERARFASGDWLWIHSISVGETLLALKIIAKIREDFPQQKIALSVTTSTGFAVAKAHACDWLEVLYNPLDARVFVRRALAAIQPQRLIFMEAIWPNLLAEAKKRGVPVTFLPRLSPRSERRFRRSRFFSGPLFRLLDALAVQEPEDMARWESLGVNSARIFVTGNSKFDHVSHVSTPGREAEFRELLARLGVAENAPVLLAGSTFPGEEKILAEILVTLRQRWQDLFLILVPRHVERRAAILAELAPLHLRIQLRTTLSSSIQPPASRGSPPPCDILLIDTTGELRDWYALSTVVFIGKSLTATGGQNPVEPVLAGKPVIFGPHMENFAAIVERWLAAEAAVQVRDAAELQAAISHLLSDPARRCELVDRAAAIVATHQGATARTVAVLLQPSLISIA